MLILFYHILSQNRLYKKIIYNSKTEKENYRLELVGMIKKPSISWPTFTKKNFSLNLKLKV